jgi:type I restriction enzyme, R subunit
MAGEEKTKEVFGDYVSVYNFKQSVDDGATVPLYYENRIPELQLTNENLNEDLERLIEEAELDEDQEKKLEREFAREYHLITREERLEKVAEDLVTHFMGRGQQGKAMVVSIDKATAVRMYDKVQKHWHKYLEDLRAQLRNEESASQRPQNSPARRVTYGGTAPLAPWVDAEYAVSLPEASPGPALGVEAVPVVADVPVRQGRGGGDANLAPNASLAYLAAKIKYMEETDMAVVVSPSQNEVEEFAKKGLDIMPHRKRMVSENLDEKFKDPDNPFRIVFVCTMCARPHGDAQAREAGAGLAQAAAGTRRGEALYRRNPRSPATTLHDGAIPA